MKLFKTHKKAAIAGLALIVAVMTGGAAYAYFTSNGSGTGSAAVGTTAGVTISQIGPAYNSIIPTPISGDQYFQDQCFRCQGLTQFGNQVALATTGQLENVVVAFRNWGPAFNDVPITLSFYNPGVTTGSVGSAVLSYGVPVADMVTPSFAAVNGDGSPSVTDVTFDFSSQFAFLPSPVIYSIAFDASGNAGSLNVALSSSSTNLSVGTDSYPGYVFAETTNANQLQGDASSGNPSCATSAAGVFAAIHVWCGSPNEANIGAYGNAQGADIPAVQINVVGGTTPPVFPGGPAVAVNYVINNTSSSAVYVHTVSTSVNPFTYQPNGGLEACTAGFFAVADSTVNSWVPANGTYYGTASLTMTDDGNNQDNCEGISLGLTFSSN